MSYKQNQDALELKEEELILLQDENQLTSDVLTLTESTEISSRRRLGHFVQAG